MLLRMAISTRLNVPVGTLLLWSPPFPSCKYTPSGQWAAGWEQGSQFGEHHPNDQEWLDGYWAGYDAAMDKRFPGWRSQPADDEDETP